MLGLASVMPHFQTTDPVFVQEKVFDERLLAQLRPERIQDHIEAYRITERCNGPECVPLYLDALLVRIEVQNQVRNKPKVDMILRYVEATLDDSTQSTVEQRDDARHEWEILVFGIQCPLAQPSCRDRYPALDPTSD
jgi:hypothetical protein